MPFGFIFDSFILADVTTKVKLPKEIEINGQKYQLLGLGARTVTFLSISVYVVGIYLPVSTALDQFSSTADIALQDQWALVLAPVRGTNFSHLRDGFVRTLVADVSPSKSTPELHQQQMSDINHFKGLFPQKIVTKGQLLILNRQKNSLSLTLDGELIDTVTSNWIPQSIALAYLRESKPVSPLAQKSVSLFLKDRLVPGVAVSS
jgi:hypothetical protein